MFSKCLLHLVKKRTSHFAFSGEMRLVLGINQGPRGEDVLGNTSVSLNEVRSLATEGRTSWRPTGSGIRRDSWERRLHRHDAAPPSRFSSTGFPRLSGVSVSGLSLSPRPSSSVSAFPPLPSLLPFSNLRAPPGSRSLPCGSAARSPRPQNGPTPPLPLPLTWQRRRQPCWSSSVLCAGRGRDCAVPDCSATAAAARRRGRICKVKAATGADLVRGGTVVRIDFGAVSAHWEAGEGRRRVRGPGSRGWCPLCLLGAPGQMGVRRGCDPARRGLP